MVPLAKRLLNEGMQQGEQNVLQRLLVHRLARWTARPGNACSRLLRRSRNAGPTVFWTPKPWMKFICH